MEYFRRLCVVVIIIINNILEQSLGYIELSRPIYQFPFNSFDRSFFFKPYVNRVYIFPLQNNVIRRRYNNFVNRESYIYDDFYPRKNNAFIDQYSDYDDYDDCEDDDQSTTYFPMRINSQEVAAPSNTISWENANIPQDQLNKLNVIRNKDFLASVIRQKLTKLNENIESETSSYSRNTRRQTESSTDTTVPFDPPRRNSNSEVRYTALSTVIGNFFCSLCNNRNGHMKRNCLRVCFRRMLSNISTQNNNDD